MMAQRSSWRCKSDLMKELDDRFDDYRQVAILGHISEAERGQLAHTADPIFLVNRWILQETTALVLGRHLKIPSPIVSRIFQQMSNGMLGFNQALKVAVVPFPFPSA